MIKKESLTYLAVLPTPRLQVFGGVMCAFHIFLCLFPSQSSVLRVVPPLRHPRKRGQKTVRQFAPPPTLSPVATVAIVASALVPISSWSHDVLHCAITEVRSGPT